MPQHSLPGGRYSLPGPDSHRLDRASFRLAHHHLLLAGLPAHSIWLNGADLRALPLTERRRQLQNILPKGSAIISGALSVTGRGRRLFELMCVNDLEGVVAKRLKDAYSPRVRWLKIKHPVYSQNDGRRGLFERSSRASGASGNRMTPLYSDLVTSGPIDVEVKILFSCERR